MGNNPNLFIIGAGKCGTTTLFNWLSNHPDIYAAPEKEPHYYSVAFSGGTGPWGALPHISSIEDYRALFSDAGDQAYRMEASASYLYYPGTAEKIKADCPDSRLVALFRDPVERAVSDYKMQRMLGHETRSFQRTLDEMEDPTKLEYLSQGLYSQQLQRYQDVFGREAINILLYEDFFSDPVTGMSSLLGWLGLDEQVPLGLEKKYNIGGNKVPLNRGLYRFAKKLSPIFPRRLVQHGKNMLTKDFTIRQEWLDWLTDYYAEDRRKLAEMTGWDLSSWRS